MMLITGITGLSGRAFYDVLCRENYPEKLRLLVRPISNVSMFEHSPLDFPGFIEREGNPDGSPSHSPFLRNPNRKDLSAV